MKNRFISALLAGCMIFGGFQMAIAEEKSENMELNVNEKRVERFIKGMGFSERLSDTEIAPGQKMTRADFAVLLSESLGLNVKEKGETFFEEIFSETDNSNVLITDENMKKSQFADVTEEHPAYTYIGMVKTFGLMNGTSNTTFSPDSNITVIQATKALLTALNYSVVADMRGGYPNGYKEVAEELKLYKGIDKKADDELDWITMQKLIYNALHSYVFKQVGYGMVDEFTDKDSELLITKAFDIEIMEGVITDNGISSLTGAGVAGDYRIKIGDDVFSLTEDTAYLKDYLGHNVMIYYYSEDSDNAFEVKYGDMSEDEKTITFDISDFEGIEGTAVKYYDNEKLKRTNTVEIPYVILNGEAVSSYDDTIFDFTEGSISLVSWDDSKANVIAINKKEYAVVERVDSENNKIFNKLRTNKADNLNVINLEDYDFVSIKDETGKNISASELSAGDVLEIVRGKKAIDIEVTKKVVEGFTVKNISQALSGKMIINDGETSYSIVNDYFSLSEYVELAMGKTYKLYLNQKGDVVWAESSENATGKKPAIFIKSGMMDETGEEEYFIKFYDGDENFKRLTLNEKISFNGDKKKTKDIISLLDNYKKQLILYELDDSGKISSITLPADYGDRSDRGLYKLNVSKDETGKDVTMSYSGHAMCLGGNIFVGSGCVTYTVPVDDSELEEIGAYKSGSTGFSDNVSYLFDAYALELDTPQAKYMVLRKGDAAGTVNNSSLVIESISHVLDDDGLPCYMIRGYGSTVTTDETVKLREYIVDSEVEFIDYQYITSNNGSDDIAIPAENMVIDDLSKGDIIRISLNAQGKIKVINLAYDYSKDEAKDFGGNEWSHNFQTQKGYPYYVQGGFLKFAKGVRPEEIDFSENNGITAQNSFGTFRISSSKIVTVDATSGKVQVRQGTTNDITTYLNTRSSDSSSRMVLMSQYSAYAYLMVVYND